MGAWYTFRESFDGVEMACHCKVRVIEKDIRRNRRNMIFPLMRQSSVNSSVPVIRIHSSALIWVSSSGVRGSVRGTARTGCPCSAYNSSIEDSVLCKVIFMVSRTMLAVSRLNRWAFSSCCIRR